MAESKQIDADNNKTILDNGVVKTEGVLHAEKRRNKIVCAALVILAGSLSYWASGIGIGGFFAFLFLVIPVLATAFIYYSKVKRATYLLNLINEVNDPLSTITIREYVTSKVWKTTGVAIVSWLFGFLFSIGLVKSPLVPIVSFIVFGGAVITRMHFIKCPRCKTRVNPLYPFGGYTNYCAGCGISFDEIAIPGKEKLTSDHK